MNEKLLAACKQVCVCVRVCVRAWVRAWYLCLNAVVVLMWLCSPNCSVVALFVSVVLVLAHTAYNEPQCSDHSLNHIINS